MSSVPRRVRDEQDARVLLDRLTRSGRVLGEWCQAEGISAHSLGWWRSQLKRGGLRVVEVTSKPAVASRRSSRYILHIGEIAIEVSDDFEEATLSRLLKVLAPC